MKGAMKDFTSGRQGEPLDMVLQFEGVPTGRGDGDSLVNNIDNSKDRCSTYVVYI